MAFDREEIQQLTNVVTTIIDDRLVPVHQRFDGLELRFDKLEVGFDGLELRFDKLESRFDGLESRFNVLELRFDGMESRFNAFEVRFDGLEARVDCLDGKIDNLGKQMQEGFSRLDARFVAFHTMESGDIAGAYGDIEKLSHRVSRLEGQKLL